jgi:hypothetical protein
VDLSSTKAFTIERQASVIASPRTVRMTTSFQSASLRQMFWAHIMTQVTQRYGVSLALLAYSAVASARRTCMELRIGVWEGLVILVSMLSGFYTSMSLLGLTVQVATQWEATAVTV